MAEGQLNHDARVKTGIDGLDLLLNGGLPAHRLHLIEGDPGTLSETVTALRGVAQSHG